MRRKPKVHRLCDILTKVADKYDISWNTTLNPLTIKLSLTNQIGTIFPIYEFEESEESYEVSVSLISLSNDEIAEFAKMILSSKPIKGITERIISNKLIVLGHRTNLSRFSDQEIEKFYMEDIILMTRYERKTGVNFNKP